ncbi:hypothetical protein IMSAGC011_03699 [Lachnospiraceae bacterium]|nr:hypothetical protein IMSAGC011_03699 [Lachnospiraceae bacterium]
MKERGLTDADLAKDPELKLRMMAEASNIVKNNRYTGGRTQSELDDLARDPAHANRIEDQGIKERQIALDLEQQGRLGRVIRDPQAGGGADFIDTTTGIKWDVKSFVSYPKGHTSARKGAFKVGDAMNNINKELNRGNNVIIDTRQLIPSHITDLKNAINAAGIGNKIIWYP